MSNFRRRLMMNRGEPIPQWFKDSLVCWYDPSKQGLTNDKIEKGKPFLLKDFSKNHLDMTMHNFDGKGMSGMDGYAIDYNTLHTNVAHIGIAENIDNKTFHISLVKQRDIVIFYRGSKAFDKIPSHRVEVSGLKEGERIAYYYRVKDGASEFVIGSNGIYTLPKSEAAEQENSYIYVGFTGKFTGVCDITVKQLPLYEGALVFDGIDDYGISEHQPILTDYTVIAKRKQLEARGAIAGKYLDKVSLGAFIFEWGTHTTYNFGKSIEIAIKTNLISVQTKYMYNGTSIEIGSSYDISLLSLGSASVEGYSCSSMALYQFLLFNRTLTQDEINWVKIHIMKEPLPEPIKE